jgi:hypothetical protein
LPLSNGINPLIVVEMDESFLHAAAMRRPPGLRRAVSADPSSYIPSRVIESGSRTAQETRSCRGGVRTSVLSIVGLLALAVVVIVVLGRNLAPPDETSPLTRMQGNTVPAGGPAITGTISVAPGLAGSIPGQAVLFVIAHKGAGGPFAVQRIVGPRFPQAYRLGPDDVMMAGSPFEGEVRLSARISRSGSAGPAQPGDMEGERPGSVQVGALQADILINRVH